jgi:methionyl-tRNA formyltransferase
MRIVFAGTPPFAAAALEALLQAGHRIALVLSQPDRPSGRGLQPQPSAVRVLAQAHALPVLTPSTLRPERGGAAAEDALNRLREAGADVWVVAAYGLILPPAALAIPRGLPIDGTRVGAINIHASLLPRWRGAAPVARAIEAGDARTGVTIMQMEAGLDTGPMLLAEAIDIGADDTTGLLTERLARLGAKLVVQALQAAQSGQLRATPQPEQGVTYARKIEKREAWLDWRAPSLRLACRVRAFDPFPGASGRLGQVVAKFWRARAEPAAAGAAPAAPGTLLAAGADGIRIACGDGILVVTELQRAGGRRLPARDFLAGTPLPVGSVWAAPPVDQP